MWSKPYFKQTMRSNGRPFLLFSGILVLLITVILAVFDAEAMQKIKEASVNVPINPLGNISTLIDFIGNQYFGMLALILPMIYLITTGNRLIAAKVDHGDMAYHLASPVTRLQVAGTSAGWLAGSLAVMYLGIAGAGLGAAAVLQPGVLDAAAFLRLTGGAFLLQLAISGIVFCASCVFNRSNHALAVGAGLPVLFFAADLLAGMSDKLEFCKYLSLITLMDTDALIRGDGYAMGLIALAVIAVVTYAAGFVVFREKDLPL